MNYESSSLSSQFEGCQNLQNRETSDAGISSFLPLLTHTLKNRQNCGEIEILFVYLQQKEGSR